ncbi:MAG: MMPL family transporter [Myxococcota bacterium]|nr:MMPL family transporter [Myxococcota bacterium]
MEKLTRYALLHPAVTSALLALITLGLASQLLSLSGETGYRAYLGKDHPAIKRLDAFIDGFGGGLPMAAVWSCAETDQCENVFDPKSLSMARTVVQELRGRSDIKRVESPATTPILFAQGEDIRSETLMIGEELSPNIEMLRSRAVIDPFWSGQLVSKDGVAGAIVLELASSDSDESKAVLRALEAALAQFEDEGFRFYIVGQTAQFALTDEALAADSARLTVPMILLVSLVVLLLFRSWQSVAGALATVGLSTVWTIGLLAALGWPQNSINQTIAPLVLVMALCDSIHLLSRYSQTREATAARTRDERAKALISAAKDAGPPCLVTTLTTAAGFASFATSSLESFVRFGLICSFGILGALVLTFTVLPVVMTLLPPEKIRSSRASKMWNRILLVMVEGTRRHSKSIVIGSALIFLVLGLGALQLRVDIDEYKLYGEDSDVVKGFRFMEEHLQKPDTVELELSLPPGSELFHQEVLASLTKFVGSLDAIDGLGPVRSVLDSLAWTNRLLHEDDPQFDRLGETSGQNAELLTLLSMKDPAALDNWLSLDFRRLRVSVEADKLPQNARTEILAQVHAAIENDLGPNWGSQITGSFSVYYDLGRAMQRTQISSFAVAFFIVFIILAFYLFSLGGRKREAIGWAAAGMFPTVLPVIMTFGVMGYSGINLDLGTAMVAAILIGIAVDDTVHLLGEFYRRRVAGIAPAPAVEGAVLHVGQAILTTSIALAAGFFILTLSSWQSIASFGFLSGVTILGALAGDLWILPAIIFLWNRNASPDLPSERRVPETGDSKARKVGLSSLVCIALALELAAAGSGLLKPGDQNYLACRVMPNGVVPVVTGTTSLCNLEPFDHVIAAIDQGISVLSSSRESFIETIEASSGMVMLSVERGGSRMTLPVPVLTSSHQDRFQLLMFSLVTAALAMTFVLRVYWYSKAEAAPALVLLFAFLSAEVISIMCSQAGQLFEIITSPTVPFMAASLVHLAMTFPRERELVRELPFAVAIPYVIATAVAAIELGAVRDDPELWATSARFLIAFATGAVVFLGVNAIRAMRESPVPVEQARGQMLSVAFLAMPLVLLPVLFGFGRSLPGGQLTMMSVGGALFVLPLGYSITRYDLFDFPTRIRSSIEVSLQFLAVGGFSAMAILVLEELLGSPTPLAWAGGAILGSASATAFRSRLVNFVERQLPSSAAARKSLIEEYGQPSPEMITEDASANLLGRTLESGLEPTTLAVFLQSQSGWRPAYASLEASAIGLSMAKAGSEVLVGSSRLNLAHADVPESSQVSALRETGIALVLAIEAAGTRLGVVLVGPPAERVAYRREDLDFAGLVTRHAAVSLSLACNAAKKMLTERQRAASHRTTELAHEIGSRLVVLEKRADRIQLRPNEPQFVLREAAKISNTAKYLARTIYGMAREAEALLQGSADMMPLSDIISSAIDALENREFADSILLSLAPDLPPMRDSDALIRVVANLLDNAFKASEHGETVGIYATASESEVVIEIHDHGVGMSPRVLARVYDFSFTTRRAAGGMGYGLSISKDVIESLGGKLRLESEGGQGTRAIITLPRIGESELPS